MIRNLKRAALSVAILLAVPAGLALANTATSNPANHYFWIHNGSFTAWYGRDALMAILNGVKATGATAAQENRFEVTVHRDQQPRWLRSVLPTCLRAVGIAELAAV